MGQVVYILGLFLVAGVISTSYAVQYPEKNVRKSSLILEYSWPEPSKSLNRLPHPRSCNHFIHTKKDGSHVVKRCHGDKIFDYRSLRCQNKSSAKCWMNIVKKGSIKKVKSPFSCPFPWGLYPDKEDCSLFYECMGGKIYPMKCPDSTLFDVVERICVHSKKALCAHDSDGDNLKEPIEELEHVQERNKIRNLGRGQSEHREKWLWKSGNDNRKIEGKDINTKDRSTSQLLELLKTTTSEIDVGSQDDSSNGISRKHPSKSENKFITSKLTFAPTSTENPKSLRRSEYSEEDSSVEKFNEISSNYELEKSKSLKIQSLLDDNYNKNFTNKIISSHTEKPRITPSSQSSHSSELPIQSTTVKSFVSTENELKPSSTTIIPEDSEKDGNINGKTGKISFLTEQIPKELTSLEESSHQPVKITAIHEASKANSDVNGEITKVARPTGSTSVDPTSTSELSGLKNIDSTTKIHFTPNSSTVRPTVAKNVESKSEASTVNFLLCPGFDGFFPYPGRGDLFLSCSAGKATVMKCPKPTAFYPSSRSCQLLYK